jgi:oligopeptide/dipeptide ABC transporter ATP-binding protein
VAVMYLGRIVEEGPRGKVLRRPKHPYTAALLESVPVPEPRPERRPRQVQGDPPSPLDPPTGCPFHPRCQVVAQEIPALCSDSLPPLGVLHEEHRAACHFPLLEGR